MLSANKRKYKNQSVLLSNRVLGSFPKLTLAFQPSLLDGRIASPVRITSHTASLCLYLWPLFT